MKKKETRSIRATKEELKAFTKAAKEEGFTKDYKGEGKGNVSGWLVDLGKRRVKLINKRKEHEHETRAMQRTRALRTGYPRDKD